MKPLVSVLCLCYNHEAFVVQALESVLLQTYPFIEIIIIDDASTDNSIQQIEKFMNTVESYGLSQTPNITFFKNEKNQGNCKSFNQAFQKSKGDLIIDFSTDDLMLLERIQLQVEQFEKLDQSYGVVFSNAGIINKNGDLLRFHFPINQSQKSKVPIKDGVIYEKILKQYYVCTPTMMIKREVIEHIGGYDETLSYEDFDFWVRTTKQYQYAYLDNITTFKRDLPSAHSQSFFKKKQNEHLASSLKVCYKAYHQNSKQAENEALAYQVKYFLRLSFYTQNFSLTTDFYKLLKKLVRSDFLSRNIVILSRLKLPVYFFYKNYRIFQKKLKLF